MNRAQRKHPRMKLGLIVITMRQHGPHIAKILARQALAEAQHLHERTGVVGFDIAGPERGNPPRLFRSAYEIARLGRLGLTAHAGEDAPAEYVWQAVDELGVDRVGHGCAAVRDPELLKRLARDKIAVEVLPVEQLPHGRGAARHARTRSTRSSRPACRWRSAATTARCRARTRCASRCLAAAQVGVDAVETIHRDGRRLHLHPPGDGAARPSGARTLDLTRKRTDAALRGRPATGSHGTSPCALNVRGERAPALLSTGWGREDAADRRRAARMGWGWREPCSEARITWDGGAVSASSSDPLSFPSTRPPHERRARVPVLRGRPRPGRRPARRAAHPEGLLLVLANNPWWRPEAGLCDECAAGFEATLELRARPRPASPAAACRSCRRRCGSGASDERTGRGVTIAFLDSGFFAHPDLVEPRDRILPTWT